MAEHIALELPLEQDLRAFSLYLWQQGYPHRVSEHRGRQVLWVAEEAQCEPVRALYRDFIEQNLAPEPVQMVSQPRRSPWRGARHQPVTLGLLLLSVLGAALVWVNFDWVLQLTFYRVTVIDNQRALFEFPSGEYWRLITPIFLHFGLLHIVFNGLWTWELGRRIETLQGSVQLLGITALIGIGSNLAQALVTQSGLFGGMSGVIYGYLGYMVVWSRLRPQQSFGLPGAIVAFMLGWLLLCLVGFAGALGMGEIANAAHVGGLLMGALLGGLAALVAGRAGQ